MERDALPHPIEKLPYQSARLSKGEEQYKCLGAYYSQLAVRIVSGSNLMFIHSSTNVSFL